MSSGPLWRREIYERRIGNIKEADRLKRIMDKNERPPRPGDHGSDVVGDRGAVIGIRHYSESQTSNSWEVHTVYPDGSGTWHCGGPCGDLDYDEFGNT